MTSPAACGWRQDKHDPRDRTSGQLRAAARVATVKRASHLSFRVERLEQGRASACVSFAKARAIATAIRLISVDAPALLAPGPDYAWARFQEYAGLPEDQLPQEVPPDVGSFPRVSLQATRAVGMVPWDRAPYDWREVQTRPDSDLLTAAYDLRTLEFYRIDEVGLARSEAAADFMRRGFPVIYGMDVDTAFFDHRGSDAVGYIDPADIQGGHMLAALEVEDDGTVLSDNWWGPEWGFEDGMFRMTPDLFGSVRVRDVYALRLPSLPDW